METTKFLRIKTERGNVLLSANVVNGFTTNNSTFRRVNYKIGWNQGKAVGYRITPIALGTSTSVVANKLVDSNADFIAAGVSVGDTLTNFSVGGSGTVTAIDSATQLSLDTNLFPGANQAYEIDDTVFRENNYDIEKALKNSTTKVFSKKWDELVIDVETPERMIVEGTTF